MVDMMWLKQTLAAKVAKINWHDAAVYVARFIKAEEQYSLKLWSTKFFLHKVEQL